MKPFLDNSAVRVYLNEVDDTQAEQYVSVKGLTDETWQQVLRVQPFGLSTVPPKASHGVGLALGGRREQMFALGVEDPKTRPRNQKPGDGAFYNAQGEIIKFIGKSTNYQGTTFNITASSKIVLTVGGVTVKITSDGVAITGGKVTHDGKDIGVDHIHGQVQPGAGVTGPPAN